MFAIMPPAEVAALVEQERVLFAAKYKCVKGLKAPVHITLYQPFDVLYNFEERTEWIQPWASLQSGFKVMLHNFNFFKTYHSPVIFIDVVRNEELEKLHQAFVTELSKYITTREDKEYRPHFTIAYRDVPRKRLAEIAGEYLSRKFNAEFGGLAFTFGSMMGRSGMWCGSLGWGWVNAHDY